MKKGISLIVLIITIVVIVVLATAIIVNLAQSNIIKNADVAVLKNDFQTFNEELRLYKGEQLLNTEIKFKTDTLAADYEKITHNEEIYNEGQNIYNILTKLKGSKYDGKVYIQEGKIVVSNKGFTQEQLKILKSIGIEAVEQEIKITTASVSSYNSVTVKMVVSVGEVQKYYFRLGEVGEYIESDTNEYTFEGLNVNSEYTVYMKVLKADGEESIEYTQDIVTKDITGEVTITRNPEIANGEYTSEDIKVTLSYVEEIPTGYEIQYKTSETDWTTYTGEITISSNTTVSAILYNSTTEDEKASNSASITGIDKAPPTAPITLTLTKNEASITAVANGSSDDDSGLARYEYSINGTTWQTSGVFENLAEGTYTIYAKAIDKVGNESEVKTEQITITLPITSETIKNDASKYYGKYVTNYVPNNKSSIGWKIFHSDGENIYLITDDYVNISELPYGTTSAGVASTKKPTAGSAVMAKTARFSNMLNDYSTGTARISDEVKKLNYNYFITKGYSSANKNMQATAYMLDTVAWNVFGNDKCEFAIGGPTIELLFNSYNNRYGTKYEYNAASNIGYYIRLSSDKEWTGTAPNLTFKESDSLYVLSTSYDDAKVKGASHYWLATPYANHNEQIYRVSYSGIDFQYTSNINAGFRPVVCLNSEVELQASGAGYIIVEK